MRPSTCAALMIAAHYRYFVFFLMPTNNLFRTWYTPLSGSCFTNHFYTDEEIIASR